MLYIINLIVPLFYLLLLDLASFFISEARAEKLSFKVTILLAISVLLLILQDMLPSTEDHLPLMGESWRPGLKPPDRRIKNDRAFDCVSALLFQLCSA